MSKERVEYFKKRAKNETHLSDLERFDERLRTLLIMVDKKKHLSPSIKMEVQLKTVSIPKDAPGGHVGVFRLW